MSKIFLDTNVLFYTLDGNDKSKQSTARELIKRLTEEEIPVISTQVLQEFYVASTMKLHVEPLVIK